jgi:hypothetical protein
MHDTWSAPMVEPDSVRTDEQTAWMASAKEISRRAGRIFANKLPANLVSRSQEDQEDYGVDWELEPILEGEKPSGFIFKAQQKGTEKLELVNGGTTISFHGLSTRKAKYYLQELRIPTVFIVVDVTHENAYWVEIQGNSQIEQAYEEAVLRGDDSLTVHIPTSNKLPQTFDALISAISRAQDVITVRHVVEAESSRLVEAAAREDEFRAHLEALRRHADWFRLEHIERLKRSREFASAQNECDRVLRSDAETSEMRLAAALNLIVLLTALPDDATRKAQLRCDIAERALAVVSGRAIDDRLRLFTEFLHHSAQIGLHLQEFTTALGLGPGAIAYGATHQSVARILWHFSHAHSKIASLSRDGQYDMVPQAWAMLAGDIVPCAHLLGMNGFERAANALVGYFDSTIDFVVNLSVRLEDWKSAAFCVLQLVAFAPLHNRNAITARANSARETIYRFPEALRNRHLEELERSVTILLDETPK